MTLSTTEAERLAERLDWAKALNSDDAFVGAKEVEMLCEEYRDGGWSWHLTKAGAWDVFEGMVIGNRDLVSIDKDGAKRYRIWSEDFESGWHPSLIIAVELAVKEMLKDE